MQRTCDHCGKLYQRPPSVIGAYCSRECSDQGRRKSRTNRRRMRRQPGHPLAGPAGYVSEARAVLFQKIGPEDTLCHWCAAPIRWLRNQRGNSRQGIIADHLNSDPLDDRPENLVAACGSCNGTRARAIREDEESVTRADGTRSRVKRAPCAECGREFNATYGRVCSTCRKRR